MESVRKNKYAVALGSRGGSAGKGLAKTRSPEHYARIQALARAKKAETLIASNAANQQAVVEVKSAETK